MYPRVSIAVRVIISITQLIGGLSGLWILSGFGQGIVIPIFGLGPGLWLLVLFASAIAGAILLWRSPFLGILISLAVQAAQIPLIETPEFGYRLGIGLYQWIRTAPFSSTFSYGTNFSFSNASGTYIEPGPSTYGVNGVALIFFCLLLGLLLARVPKRTPDVAPVTP